MPSELCTPGSDAALHIGCVCPRIDNGYGRGYLGGVKDPDTGETMFVITAGCPIHSPSLKRTEPSDA